MNQMQTGLRADARRNRDALLVAARRVFATAGLDAPLDTVVREAGVGRATLYRNFPTRAALFDAIFDDNIDALADIASAHTADPARAYGAILTACLHMQRRDHTFIDLLANRPEAGARRRERERRVVAIVAAPLRAAQDAGLIRADLRPDDTVTIIEMLGTAVRQSAPRDRGPRAVALVLDALAAEPVHRDLDHAPRLADAFGPRLTAVL